MPEIDINELRNDIKPIDVVTNMIYDSMNKITNIEHCNMVDLHQFIQIQLRRLKYLKMIMEFEKK